MVFTEVANYLTFIKYIQPMLMSSFSGEKMSLMTELNLISLGLPCAYHIM